MRHFISALLLFFTVQTASAQYNFYNVAVGVSGGITRPYSDLTQYRYGKAASLTASYFFSPFMELNAEIQLGDLAGGNRYDNRHLREFANSYKSVLFSGNLQVGEFIDYERSRFLYRIRGLYGGAGMGIIYNKMTFVQRVKPDGSGYVFPGKDEGLNFSFPLRIGYQFKIYDSYQEP
ncbi:MAG: hypothetical protein INR69_16670, partial [Mucilaginibacter polytrichastri]|nr:hypothetical protein [Mucilaginibacter polytrichastri]